LTSVILQTVVKLLLPVTLLFALHLFIKGHNAPGGGFIGGLTAAIAIVLYRLAFGPVGLYRLLPLHPRVLVFAGLAIATITGIIPLIFGEPMLRSLITDIDLPLFAQPLHFVSVFFFDIGVVLVVVGVSVGMITRLSEELEVQQ
jgi:multisubunit Na+/H+ antiporter MnhB subunit